MRLHHLICACAVLHASEPTYTNSLFRYRKNNYASPPYPYNTWNRHRTETKKSSMVDRFWPQLALLGVDHFAPHYENNLLSKYRSRKDQALKENGNPSQNWEIPLLEEVLYDTDALDNEIVPFYTDEDYRQPNIWNKIQLSQLPNSITSYNRQQKYQPNYFPGRRQSSFSRGGYWKNFNGKNLYSTKYRKFKGQKFQKYYQDSFDDDDEPSEILTNELTEDFPVRASSWRSDPFVKMPTIAPTSPPAPKEVPEQNGFHRGRREVIIGREESCHRYNLVVCGRQVEGLFKNLKINERDDKHRCNLRSEFLDCIAKRRKEDLCSIQDKKIDKPLDFGAYRSHIQGLIASSTYDCLTVNVTASSV